MRSAHAHFSASLFAGLVMSNRAAGERIFINLLAGPPVGSGAIFAWAVVDNAISGRGTYFGDGAVAGILILFMFGYVFGLLPALLNALITAWLFPRLPRRGERLLVSLLTGAASTLAIIGWFTLGAWQSDESNPLLILGMLASTGALASLLASGIVEILQARRSRS